MRMTFTVAQMLVRITGVLQLLLGLLFWTGDALALIPVHMLVGVLMVLGLWLLAALASQMGVPASMWLLAVVLGAAVAILGFTQVSLLPGSTHWIVQVAHLLLGLGAIASGEMIGGRVRRDRLAAAAA